ncbi:FadR/GntR family transcriptional regulator [Amycolatopsis japonica]|uniref:FadR/GntR family transcriptional regulator n=1 Tax=Amycolatopsis japonica TaxID=208439 RepID=UPI00366F25CB
MAELAAAVARSSAVAEHLAAEIEQLPAGRRIGTKKQLCARLGVAGATLTEAVRLLQERGLVTVRPGPKGGLFTARPDPFRRLGQDLGVIGVVGNPELLVDDAVEVRQSLEVLVVLDAARSRTSEEVDGLREQLAKVEKAAVGSFAHEATQLHRRIALCASNKILQTVYSGVLSYLDSTTPSVPDDPALSRYQEQAAALRELVESVIAQDEMSCHVALRRLHDLGPF